MSRQACLIPEAFEFQHSILAIIKIWECGGSETDPLRARNRDKDYPAALNVGTAVGALGSLVGTVVGTVIFCVGTVTIVTELNFFTLE